MHGLRTLLFATLLLAPSVGAAQEDALTPEQRSKAHFEKGAEYRLTGEYAKAVLEFIRGHEVAPHPLFLYNIADSYVQMGNFEKAREAAISCRDTQGLDDKTTSKNLARLAAVERVLFLQGQDWSAKPQFVAAIAPTEPATPSGTETESSTTAVVPAASDEHGLGSAGWAGVAGAGVGAALLLTWGALELSLGQPIEDFEAAAAAGDTDEMNRLEADIHDQQGAARLVLWSGVGLTTLGLGLIAWELSSGEQNTTTLRVAPSGIALSRAF